MPEEARLRKAEGNICFAYPREGIYLLMKRTWIIGNIAVLSRGSSTSECDECAQVSDLEVGSCHAKGSRSVRNQPAWYCKAAFTIGTLIHSPTPT